jgi:hypothetical protein
VLAFLFFGFVGFLGIFGRADRVSLWVLGNCWVTVLLGRFGCLLEVFLGFGFLVVMGVVGLFGSILKGALRLLIKFSYFSFFWSPHYQNVALGALKMLSPQLSKQLSESKGFIFLIEPPHLTPLRPHHKSFSCCHQSSIQKDLGIRGTNSFSSLTKYGGGRAKCCNQITRGSTMDGRFLAGKDITRATLIGLSSSHAPASLLSRAGDDPIKGPLRKVELKIASPISELSRPVSTTESSLKKEASPTRDLLSHLKVGLK